VVLRFAIASRSFIHWFHRLIELQDWMMTMQRLDSM
jgi:hypothetical protein